MLKLILPLIALIIITKVLKTQWWVNATSLIVLTLYSIKLLSYDSTLKSMSQFFALDTISVVLIILRIFIARIIFIARSKIYLENLNTSFFALINISLLLVLIYCFSASRMLLFYIWFEASLIPTIVIIITWGYQPERVQARIYLILYTVTASLPILIIFCGIFFYSKTNLISIISEIVFPQSMSIHTSFWIISIAGFLVKLPIFSTHLWLPKAHVEAPIAGSIVLAAILLKLGGYGLARIIQIFPKINLMSSPIIIRISLTGAVATRIICLRQPDLKSLIAYSSVGHIGLILAGILSNSNWGIYGALIIIISHGLRSSALFILANMSYELTHTRRIFLTKGIIIVGPTITIWWFLFTAANIAAPPTINLIREIILISSILSYSGSSVLLIRLIRFLTAAYSLHIFATTQHGQIGMFINPVNAMKVKDILLLFLHISPIIILIIKAEIITSWC